MFDEDREAWQFVREDEFETEDELNGPFCNDDCKNGCDGHVLLDIKNCSVEELIETLQEDNPKLLETLCFKLIYCEGKNAYQEMHERASKIENLSSEDLKVKLK